MEKNRSGEEERRSSEGKYRGEKQRRCCSNMLPWSKAVHSVYAGQTDDRSIVPRTDGVSRGRRQSWTGPPTPFCGGFLLIKFLCCPLDGSSEPDC